MRLMLVRQRAESRRLTGDRGPKVLVAWYGSLAGHGTIGDLLAVGAPTSMLLARDYDFVHWSATSGVGILGRNVAWEEISPNDFDVLLFVCGPIIAGHPVVTKIVERFSSATRVGVGVSLLTADSASFVNPFDVVFAREGAAARFEDVAILAYSEKWARPYEQRDTLRIGVSLSGSQSEYGIDWSVSSQARPIVEAALAKIGQVRPVEQVWIEHRLQDSALPADEFDAVYRGCDLIVTSRFHGAIMAMRNGVPFIALDQIRGGAKIVSLLARRGWPHVYRLDGKTSEELASIALAIVEDLDHWRGELRRHARRTSTKASATLAALDRYLQAFQRT